jgi:hypothetical protein
MNNYSHMCEKALLSGYTRLLVISFIYIYIEYELLLILKYGSYIVRRTCCLL